MKVAPAHRGNCEFAIWTFVNGQPFVVRAAWKSFEPEIEYSPLVGFVIVIVGARKPSSVPPAQLLSCPSQTS